MSPDGASLPDPQAVAEAARALLSGRLVAIPTETVYGLAADAGNEGAVAAIYSLKGRPADHPVIVHVSTAARARQWGQFSAAATTLANEFWPGPMTLICPLLDGMPTHACAGHDTVGLRVPSHPVAQALLQDFESHGGLGVAAPSANRFGHISPTRASHVQDDYGENAPLILDGGHAQVGVESTIVDVSGPSVRILRPGAIEAAQIARVLGQEIDSIGLLAKSPDANETAQPLESAVPAAPGTLAAHYAPNTSLTLVPAGQLEHFVRNRLKRSQRLAVYSMNPIGGDLAQQGPALYWHEMPASAADLAFRLYDDLRHLDSLDLDELLVEIPPATPGFAAIIDRLARAQTGSGQAAKTSI